MDKRERQNRRSEFIRACCESTSHADSLLKHHPELLEERDAVGETPLHYLVIENRLDAVDYLLQRGADVNTRSIGGKTPLMHAAILGLTKAIELLVGRGADINAVDELGETALHHAATSRRKESVALLVRLGADRAIQSTGGYTPLDELNQLDYLRARARRGSAEKLKELLGRVPDVEPDTEDRIQ